MNHTEKMQAILRAAGIPFKDGWLYGSHGVFTFYSHEAAMKAARAFQAATFKVRGPIESRDDYTHKPGERIKCNPTPVWRVGLKV